MISVCFCCDGRWVQGLSPRSVAPIVFCFRGSCLVEGGLEGCEICHPRAKPVRPLTQTGHQCERCVYTPVWVFTTYFIPKNASGCCSDPDLCGNERCISPLSAAVPPVPLAATWDSTSISDPKTEKTEGFYCVIHEGWIENSQPRISRGENEAKLKQRRD